LAVSNRGICHNRTGDYTGALAAADMVHEIINPKPYQKKTLKNLKKNLEKNLENLEKTMNSKDP
jgi:hypothetical protein